MDSRTDRARAARAVFPPEQVAEVKAVACELPVTHGVPLSRFSRTELHRLVVERGVSDASASTIWRWLAEDAIKPWQVRSWLFRRDPDFREKAGRVLDLYARRFEGKRLHPGEFVVSADESQLQALARRHPTAPPAPARPCEPSSSTAVVAPSLTSLPGTSTTRASSTGSSRGLGSSPSGDSSSR